MARAEGNQVDMIGTALLALVATISTMTSSPREMDLRHQELDLQLDAGKGLITGNTTLTLEPLRPDLTHVQLDAVDLEVERASVDGEPAQVNQLEGALRLALPRPQPPVGQPLTITIHYRARPTRGFHIINNGTILAYTQNQPSLTRWWMPTLDVPWERATFSVSVTLPAGMRFVGTGQVTADVVVSGAMHKVTRQLDQAVPPYLLSVVLGRLEEVPLARDPSSMPARAHVPPGRSKDARDAFESLPTVLASLQRWTGTPYPFASLDLVILDPFPFSGMENAAAPTLDASVLPEPGVAVMDTRRDLWIHELAHQWFGVHTVVADERCLWIQEGLATYLAYLVDEDLRGIEEAREDFLQAHLLPRIANPAVEDDRSLSAPPTDDPEAVFDDVTYHRGALLFHTLRGRLGDAGFAAVLRLMLLEHGGSVLDQDDLLNALRAVTGVRHDDWLKAWTISRGHPSLSLTTTTDPRTSSLTVKVVQPRPAQPLWTTLSVGHAGQETRIPLALDTEQTVITVPGIARADWLVVDDEGWLLAAPPRADVNSNVAALAGAPRSQTRTAAARALAEQPGSMTLEALTRALRQDKSAVVRAACARSLADVHTPPITEALVAALKDPAPRVQRDAATALCHHGDANTARVLAKVAGAPGPMNVREAAASSLGCHVSVAGDLVDRALRLKTARSRVEAAVLEGVGRVQPTHPLLLDALGNGDAPRAVAAAGSVGRDPANSVVALLVRRLRDPSAEVRGAAADALVRLGFAEAIPALRDAERREPIGPTRLSMKRAAEGLAH